MARVSVRPPLQSFITFQAIPNPPQALNNLFQGSIGNVAATTSPAQPLHFHSNRTRLRLFFFGTFFFIATSVNPIDWKVRKGEHGENRKFPLILGWDVSGTIEKVGSDVHDYKVGDEVYARPDVSRPGTYAEYVAVRANEIYFKPKSVDHTTAAAIPLAGLTAWQGIFDHGKLQAGQKVLIHGRIGRCGYFCRAVGQMERRLCNRHRIC
jgi:hypothetical protein